MTAQELKNSILQLAVQGKLVSQDPADEPASELLKRIADERTRRIAAGTLVVDKKHTAVPITENDILYDLPENWKWARLADILLHLFLLLGMGLYLENCIPIRQTHSHCYCDEHKPL